MATDNEIAARLFYEALGTGDTTLLDEALADDWEAVPAMRTGPGPDGWRKTIDHLRGAYGDLRVTIEQVVADGDLVAVRSTGRGVDGTGREVEFRAADFHRLAGGRIVRTWHLEGFDNAA